MRMRMPTGRVVSSEGYPAWQPGSVRKSATRSAGPHMSQEEPSQPATAASLLASPGSCRARNTASCWPSFSVPDQNCGDDGWLADTASAILF
jgi:hypothetical protein